MNHTLAVLASLGLFFLLKDSIIVEFVLKKKSAKQEAAAELLEGDVLGMISC